MILPPDESILLKALRANARTSYSRISRDTGIPISTVISKVRALIHKLDLRPVSLLRFPELHYYVRVCLALSCKDRTALLLMLDADPHVNTLLRLNGEMDFFVDALFRQMADLEAFLEEMRRKGVKNHQMFYLIKEFKNEEFDAF